MVLETYMNLFVAELDFLGFFFFAPNIEKANQKWAKYRVFEFIKKVV